MDWVPKLCLTKKQQGVAIGDVRATVICGLGTHIGQVDAFAKHVSGHWGFWRRDTQTLAQNTTEIGGAGAVP